MRILSRGETLLLFLLLHAMCCHAQANGKAYTKFIVYDSLTHETIPFVNIALSSPTDTLFSCTNDSGSIVFRTAPGRYVMKASCVGYRDYSKEVVAGSYAVIPVYMASESKTLTEVTVVGRREHIKMTHEGIVYDMSADKSVQSSTLLSALQQVPLINVDPNNNITVKGSSRYSIYMNGRPYRIAMTNPKEILQGIPASTISKVEVITNIDGRYDADAGDAIINIVTEKHHLTGYTLTAYAGAATQPKGHAGATFTGTKGNVDFSVGYDFHNEGQRNQPIETENSFTEGNSKVFMAGKGDGDWNTHTVRGLLTWTIDSLNSLYLDGHALFKQTNLSTQWEQSMAMPGQNTIHTRFVNDNSNWAGTAETNVVYRHFLPTNKNKENFSAGYRYTYNPDKRNYQQDYTGAAGSGSERYKRATNGGLNEHTLMADLLLPAGKGHELHLGGKQIFRSGHTKASLYEWLNNEWTAPTHVDAPKEDMDYTQNISSLYASYTGLIGKLSLNASLRWEHASLNMRLNHAPGVASHDNILIPHLGLSYRISKSTQLSLNYSGGIQRPDITMLNPFTAVYSSYAAGKGNPNLLYPHTHTLGAGLMSFGPKLFMSYDLSFQQLNDAVVPYSYQEQGSTLLTDTYRNIDCIRATGGNIYINYRPVSMLSLTATGNLTYGRMKSSDWGLNQHWWEYNLTFMGNLSIKQWAVGLQYGNYKNRPDAWSKSDAFSLYSCYVSRSFLKNALNVKITVNSPFNKYETLRVRKQYQGFASRQTNYMTARSFGINVSYTLRSGKPRNIKRDNTLRSTDQETGVR